MLTISGSKEKEKVSEAACLAGSKTCSYYSHSTKTNAFCLGIILCNVSRSFDYLIYPYYPAYTS